MRAQLLARRLKKKANVVVEDVDDDDDKIKRTYGKTKGART